MCPIFSSRHDSAGNLGCLLHKHCLLLRRQGNPAKSAAVMWRPPFVRESIVSHHYRMACVYSPPQAEAWLKPALQLNDAAAEADRHRLRAIVGAEFAHDVLDVDLDGLLRDEQPRGDIPIPVARCDLL